MHASSSYGKGSGTAKSGHLRVTPDANQTATSTKSVRGTRSVPREGSYTDVPRNFLSGMDRALFAPSYLAGAAAGRGASREGKSRRPIAPPLPSQLAASSKGSFSALSMPGSVLEAPGLRPATSAPAHAPAHAHALHQPAASSSRVDKVRPLSLQQALRGAHRGGKGEGLDHSNTRLALVGCNVTHISAQPVQMAHALQALYLSNNSIHTLSNIDMFAGLVSLSLGHNSLKYLCDLEPLAYPALPRLQKLSLAGNDVTDMPYYRVYCLGRVTRSLVSLDGAVVAERERQGVTAAVGTSSGSGSGSRSSGYLYRHAHEHLSALRNAELVNVALTHAINLCRCHRELSELLGNELPMASFGDASTTSAGASSGRAENTSRIVQFTVRIALNGGVYRWVQIGCADDVECYLHQQCRHSHLTVLRKLPTAAKQSLLADSEEVVQHWDIVTDGVLVRLQQATRLLLESYDEIYPAPYSVTQSALEARMQSGLQMLQTIVAFVEPNGLEEYEWWAFGPPKQLQAEDEEEEEAEAAEEEEEEEEEEVEEAASDSGSTVDFNASASANPAGLASLAIEIETNNSSSSSSSSTIDTPPPSPPALPLPAPTDYLSILGISGAVSPLPSPAPAADPAIRVQKQHHQHRYESMQGGGSTVKLAAHQYEQLIQDMKAAPRRASASTEIPVLPSVPVGVLRSSIEKATSPVSSNSAPVSMPVPVPTEQQLVSASSDSLFPTLPPQQQEETSFYEDEDEEEGEDVGKGKEEEEEDEEEGVKQVPETQVRRLQRQQIQREQSAAQAPARGIDAIKDRRNKRVPESNPKPVGDVLPRADDTEKFAAPAVVSRPEPVPAPAAAAAKPAVISTKNSVSGTINGNATATGPSPPDFSNPLVIALINRSQHSLQTNNKAGLVNKLGSGDGLADDLLAMWGRCHTGLNQVMKMEEAASMVDRLGPVPNIAARSLSEGIKTMPALKTEISRSLNDLAQLQRNEYISWHANLALIKQAGQVKDAYSETMGNVSLKLKDLHLQLQQAVGDVTTAHRWVLGSEALLAAVQEARQQLQNAEQLSAAQREHLQNCTSQQKEEAQRKAELVFSLHETKTQLLQVKKNLSSRPELKHAASLIDREDKVAKLESRSLLLVSRVLRHWHWVVFRQNKLIRIFIAKRSKKQSIQRLRKIFKAWVKGTCTLAQKRLMVTRMCCRRLLRRALGGWRVSMRRAEGVALHSQHRRKVLLHSGVHKWRVFMQETVPLIQAARLAEKAKLGAYNKRRVFLGWKAHSLNHGWVAVWRFHSSSETNCRFNDTGARKWHMQRLWNAWRKVLQSEMAELHCTGSGLQDNSAFQIRHGVLLLSDAMLSIATGLAAGGDAPAEEKDENWSNLTTSAAKAAQSTLHSIFGFDESKAGAAYIARLTHAKRVAGQALQAWLQVWDVCRLRRKMQQSKGMRYFRCNALFRHTFKRSLWKANVCLHGKSSRVRASTLAQCVRDETLCWMQEHRFHDLHPALISDCLAKQSKRNTKTMRRCMAVLWANARRERLAVHAKELGSYRRYRKRLIRGWAAIMLNLQRTRRKLLENAHVAPIAPLLPAQYNKGFPPLSNAGLSSNAHQLQSAEYDALENSYFDASILETTADDMKWVKHELPERRVGGRERETIYKDVDPAGPVVSAEAVEAMEQTATIRLNGQWYDREELRRRYADKLKEDDDMRVACARHKESAYHRTLTRWLRRTARKSFMSKKCMQGKKQCKQRALRLVFGTWNKLFLQQMRSKIRNSGFVEVSVTDDYLAPVATAADDNNNDDDSMQYQQSVKPITEEIRALDCKIATRFVDCKAIKIAFDGHRDRARYLKDQIGCEVEEEEYNLRADLRDQDASNTALRKDAQRLQNDLAAVAEECRIIRAMEEAYAEMHPAYVKQNHEHALYAPTPVVPEEENLSEKARRKQLAAEVLAGGNGTLTKMLAGAAGTGMLNTHIPLKGKKGPTSPLRTPPRPAAKGALVAAAEVWDTPTLMKESDEIILEKLVMFGLSQTLVAQSPLVKRLLPVPSASAGTCTRTSTVPSKQLSSREKSPEQEHLEELSQQIEKLREANRLLEESISSDRLKAAKITSDAQLSKDEIFAQAEAVQEVALHRRKRVIELDAQLQQLKQDRKAAETQLQYCSEALNDALLRVTRRTTDIDAQIELLDKQKKAADVRSFSAKDAQADLQKRIDKVRAERAILEKRESGFFNAPPTASVVQSEGIGPSGGISVNASVASLRSRSEEEIELEAIEYLGHHRGVLESSRLQVSAFELQDDRGEDSLNITVPQVFRSFLTDGPPPRPPQHLLDSVDSGEGSFYLKGGANDTDDAEDNAGEGESEVDNDDTLSIDSSAAAAAEASGPSDHPSISIMNRGGSTSTLGISLSYDLDKLGGNVSALDMVLGGGSGTGTGPGAPKHAPPEAFVKGLPPRTTSGGISLNIDTTGLAGRNPSPRGSRSKSVVQRQAPTVLKPTIPRIPLHAPKRAATAPAVATSSITAAAPTNVKKSVFGEKNVPQAQKGKGRGKGKEMRFTQSKPAAEAGADENSRSGANPTAGVPSIDSTEKDTGKALGTAISELSQRIRKRLEFLPD